MCWVADTGNGVYEAESLKELKFQIAERYSEDEDPSIDNIEKVYWQNDAGYGGSLSARGLSIFIDECETLNLALAEEHNDQMEGWREIESDYYASLL